MISFYGGHDDAHSHFIGWRRDIHIRASAYPTFPRFLLFERQCRNTNSHFRIAFALHDFVNPLTEGVDVSHLKEAFGFVVDQLHQENIDSPPPHIYETFVKVQPVDAIFYILKICGFIFRNTTIAI
jgi:hypothetical protein